MKKLILSLLAAATLIGAASSVEAHTKCKVRLPFGGWTEGCPGHSHPQRRQQRLYPSNPNGRNVHPNAGRSGGGSGKKYYFYVDNYDNYWRLAYRYNGKTYRLSPGSRRKHYSSNEYVTVTFDDIAGNSGFQPWSKRFSARKFDIGARYDSSRVLRFKLRN